MRNDTEQNLTPSELNRQVRTLLESHYDFVWVTGEISNFAAPSSGHWYFSLKDDDAQVRCAMFRGRNQRLRFRPQNGDAIRLRARVSLYEGRGEFQLIGEFMEPAGAGALQARFEAVRDKLALEGLFEATRKQALPEVVKHVAVITSPTGAALQDILQVLGRRNPMTRVSILPVAVQGTAAAPEICAALGRVNRLAAAGEDIDVVILARGGGSLEDLWAFNEEPVARAIAASTLPIVAGVGHETDVTIADFAADVRAPTPSAAAEIVSSDLAEVIGVLRQQRQRLRELVVRRLGDSRRDLSHLRARMRHPGARLREQTQRLDELELRLHALARRRLASESHQVEVLRLRMRSASPGHRIVSAQRRLADTRNSLSQKVQRRLEDLRRRSARHTDALRTLNPLAILQRGYAILSTENGDIVSDSASVDVRDSLQARLARGRLKLRVEVSSGDEESD